MFYPYQLFFILRNNFIQSCHCFINTLREIEGTITHPLFQESFFFYNYMKISVLNVKSLGLKMFSLVGFNDTLNTIKGYISVQSKGVYRQVLSGNHKATE